MTITKSNAGLRKWNKTDNRQNNDDTLNGYSARGEKKKANTIQFISIIHYVNGNIKL